MTKKVRDSTAPSRRTNAKTPITVILVLREERLAASKDSVSVNSTFGSGTMLSVVAQLGCVSRPLSPSAMVVLQSRKLLKQCLFHQRKCLQANTPFSAIPRFKDLFPAILMVKQVVFENVANINKPLVLLYQSHSLQAEWTLHQLILRSKVYVYWRPEKTPDSIQLFSAHQRSGPMKTYILKSSNSKSNSFYLDVPKVTSKLLFIASILFVCLVKLV